MQENTNNKTDIETDIGKKSSTEPRKTQAKKQPKKPDPNSDFKRKYFDYYDDVKISDRQDW